MKFGFRNNGETAVKSYYHTVIHPFRKGDVPLGQSVQFGGTTQFDIVSRHPDGSVRDALITKRTGDVGPAELVSADSACTIPNGDPSHVAALRPDITVELTVNGKTDIYAPNYDQPFDNIISGPMMSEHRYVIDIDEILSLVIDVQSYEDGTTRSSVSLEAGNIQPAVPMLKRYDATIKYNGKPVRTEKGVVHFPHTVWREVINDYPLQPIFDMGYLAYAGAIPYYDATLAPTEKDYVAWLKKQLLNSALWQAGVIRPGWPATGYGPELATLPSYVAAYLMTQDARAWNLMRDIGERAGYWDTFYRDPKTKRVCTVATHPDFSSHVNFSGKPNGEPAVIDPLIPLDPKITDPKKQNNKVTLKTVHGLVAEDSHAPNMSYIPARLLGDRWHRERQQGMAFFAAVCTAPDYRQGAKGLLDWKETRGLFWGLRDVMFAAAVSWDSDPAHPDLVYQADANFDQLAHKTSGANAMADPANTLHVLTRLAGDNPPDASMPWQNDYGVPVLYQGKLLGFDKAGTMLEWCAEYTNGRADGDNGWPWEAFALFEAFERGVVGAPPLTRAAAWTKTQAQTGTVIVPGKLFVSGTQANYVNYGQAALAVQAAYGIARAPENFAKIRAARSAVKGLTPVTPEWAYMPVPAPAVAGPAAYVPPVVIPPPVDGPDSVTVVIGGKTYKGTLEEVDSH